MVDPGMDALKLAPNYRPMTSTQMATNGNSWPSRVFDKVYRPLPGFGLIDLPPGWAHGKVTKAAHLAASRLSARDASGIKKQEAECLPRHPNLQVRSTANNAVTQTNKAMQMSFRTKEK